MRSFDLKEYLADPSKKIITRNGRKARIICTDRKTDTRHKFPIIALVELKDDTEGHYLFTEDGRYVGPYDNALDLFFAPEKQEGWINICEDPINHRVTGGIKIYKSEFLAKEDGKNSKGYIATIKIEWEE